jgi:hypothetical protein
VREWVIPNIGWLLGLCAGIGVLALALTFVLWRALLRQQEALELLAIRFGTLQEQSQRELMAMGQRVIEAEKSVRRFSERIEALEAATPEAERYGQLGSLLAGKLMAAETETTSTAELELKSLLQRGKSE